MNKNFDDFINSLDENSKMEISTKASEELKKRRELKPEGERNIYEVISGTSFFMSLCLLEKYHDWLNNN